MAANEFHYLARPAALASGDPPLLVLLHGYGSDERDLLGLAPYLDSRCQCLSVRAPKALETGGYAWFDVQFTPFGLVVDHQQAERSCRQLESWLADRVAAPGVDRRRVFLLGFSQGAGMALGVALHRPDLVAGVAFLSGLVLPRMVPTDNLESLRSLQVLMIHGRQDPLLPINRAHASRALLEKLPVELVYREFEMGHEIDEASLAEVQRWLTEALER